MYIRLVISVLMLTLVLTCSLNTEPLVTLPQGLLKGFYSETRNSRNISVFLGIPYGKPPIGKLRFRRPLAAEKWEGLRLANKEGNVCPQIEKKKVVGDENCLCLNVYTPVIKFHSSSRINSKRNLLPVMVWIHGGGFYVGSGSFLSYGPKYLLDKDVILVSMNYRLGVLGFFTTGDSVVPGNMGLKDQVLALKWVQKNIQFFGGDPARVTLFGQSSAGACVNFHALSDASNGLFHQYIIESGTSFTGWAYRNRKQFTPYINELAKKVGCPVKNSTILLKCLQDTRVYSLVNTFFDDSFNFSKLIWIPTDELESENAFLRDSPENLIKQNSMKDYPSMSGTVVDEGLSTTLNLYREKTNYTTIRSALEQYVNSTIESLSKPDANLLKMRKIIQDYYFNESILEKKDKQLLQNFTKFVSDSRFIYPEYVLLEKMANVIKSPFYLYSFGYRGNQSLVSLLYGLEGNIGVTHSEELLYLFPFLVPSNVTIKVDQQMINLMVDLWTSFAINGKPTSNILVVPNMWQPYSQDKSFLQIGNLSNNNDPAVTLKHDYFADHVHFWKENFPL